jgi:hypothetical protein
VADFEYSYDRERHAAYKVAEGSSAEPSVRWPFHRLAAACWLVLRIDPGAEVPVIETLAATARDDADEPGILAAFFETLDRHPTATLVTWGGEAKDLAILRRCADEFGMTLPKQLIDLSPHARERIDLCRAVAVQAKPVHLPEYCAATSIPCKPSPAKMVGPLVESGAWPMVKDQCLADVLATTVIGLRHLASRGLIACHPQKSVAALAESAGQMIPSSEFLRRSFAPWSRAQLAASRLKGTVVRAA